MADYAARAADPPNTPRAPRRLASLHFLEPHDAVARIHPHDVLRGELAFEDLARERILDRGLDGALQRPRAVHWIESCPGRLGERGVGDVQTDIELPQPLLQITQLDARD